MSMLNVLENWLYHNKNLQLYVVTGDKSKLINAIQVLQVQNHYSIFFRLYDCQYFINIKEIKFFTFGTTLKKLRNIIQIKYIKRILQFVILF